MRYCLNREHPDPENPFHVGVYIRYFNQTRYEDYLEKHKSQSAASIAMCPKWLLAARTPPADIYFISEDIFILVSYYLEDLHDTAFLPSGAPDG